MWTVLSHLALQTPLPVPIRHDKRALRCSKTTTKAHAMSYFKRRTTGVTPSNRTGGGNSTIPNFSKSGAQADCTSASFTCCSNKSCSQWRAYTLTVTFNGPHPVSVQCHPSLPPVPHLVRQFRGQSTCAYFHAMASTQAAHQPMGRVSAAVTVQALGSVTPTWP